MSRASVVSGGFLFLLGLLSIAEALRVRDSFLGARLMPLIVGGVLLLLGAAHLVGPAGTKPVWPEAASARRVVVMFMALALYVALMPVLGFLLATFLLALALVRMLATYSWTRTLLTTVGIAVGSHVVFQRWLSMPLPVLWE